MIRPSRLLALVALAGLAAWLPGRAAARTCHYTDGTGMTRVQFTTPGKIIVPDNAAVGDVLWTSAWTAQDATVTVDCTSSVSGGVTNYLGARPASGATVFPTNIPGLAIRLQRNTSGSYLVAAPGQSFVGDGRRGGGSFSFQYATSLQLIMTGPIATGSVLYAGQLAHWDIGDLDSVVVFQTANTTTFTGPACTVAIDPTVVNLPTVAVGAFGGTGSTTGTTPFKVQLSCSQPAPIRITLDSNNPIDRNAGVLGIASVNGAASGVGVQLAYNGAPVPLRQPITVNATQGQFAIPFTASYYRSNGALKAGSVSATATYTLTYP